jgi:type II secretory pathway pseudopilin PulG
LREISSRPRPRRRGITLIELLVVLTVLMILASAALQRLPSGMDQARTREASRAVHLYLNSARQLAMATGRPCGVMIERLPANPQCSMTLTQVETPAPYGGDSIGAVASVTLTSLSGGTAQVQATFNSGFDNNIVHVNDQIQFNYQGPWYTITSVGSGSLAGTVDQVQNLPWNGGSPGVPYEILRRPVKSAASALQLPSPAVVDLACSGPDSLSGGTASNWGSDTSPVTILFSPSGSVDRICYANNYAFAPAPIYLLVGKVEKVGMAPGQTNLDDQTNLWVAVNPVTGLIVTTDMAAVGAANLFQSRSFARQSDAMAGR